MLIRDRSAAGYDLALVTTDADASAAQVIERYASRWSIEATIEDARQVLGAGQARNRTARAVERTVPFQLACQAVTACWYATAGHDPADVAEHRARAPWYTTKAQPSTADMAAQLRRVIIAARFKASRPDQPTPEEISVLRLAWEDAAVTAKAEDLRVQLRMEARLNIRPRGAASQMIGMSDRGRIHAVRDG